MDGFKHLSSQHPASSMLSAPDPYTYSLESDTRTRHRRRETHHGCGKELWEGQEIARAYAEMRCIRPSLRMNGDGHISRELREHGMRTPSYSHRRAAKKELVREEMRGGRRRRENGGYREREKRYNIVGAPVLQTIHAARFQPLESSGRGRRNVKQEHVLLAESVSHSNGSDLGIPTPNPVSLPSNIRSPSALLSRESARDWNRRVETIASEG